MNYSCPTFSFLLGATAIAATTATALPSRIAAESHDDKSVTVIAVTDENLDLATRLERESASALPALVPLAPEIVVGQGDDASNYTFVRVLNRYGIARASFLAFAPDVRGGVQVAAARDNRGAQIIAAAPISDANTREIRLFNRLGGRVGSIFPNVGLRAPYQIASGDFLPASGGDELAVAGVTTKGQTAISIFDFAGVLRKTIALPDAGRFGLSSAREQNGARLALYFPNGKTLCEVASASGKITRRTLAIDGARNAIYPTAFAPNNWLASGPEPLLSTVDRIGATQTESVDVGQHENEFWINMKSETARSEGRYIKNASYAHLRVEGDTPLRTNPQLALSENPSDWKKWVEGARATNRIPASLADKPRKLWEPTFTHRMPGTFFDAWAKVKDEATGLPKYLSLTRKNNVSTYGEFKTDFQIATYAPGMPELDRLYLLPLRGTLDTLAVRQRARPDLIISIEPNHEHEIAIEKDETVGDYNPAMIRGFELYLQRMNGLNDAEIKARYGLPAAQSFDAPRNEDRGAWDAYSDANPFFTQWYQYNRAVVNRRLADTFTQALQAGLPPEIIKSHQIPDRFAVGSLKGFSNVSNRITPIDYAMSAGVGFGYTRYGVWFQADAQIQKAAQTSGFDSVVMGEYQALTTDQNAATAQLKYLFESGVTGIHAMNWPGSGKSIQYNETMQKAIQDLLANDRPRPGVTGGVGQIVPFVSADGKRRFDVAAIGTGANNTGLLKSLKADGTWEGTVYAVPFRTAIAVEKLAIKRSDANGMQRLSVGPLDKLNNGEQIEFTLQIRAARAGVGKFALHQKRPDGNLSEPLSGTASDVEFGAGQRNVRLIVRSQLPTDNLVMTFDLPGEVQISQTLALRETERVARMQSGVLQGERHKGGVVFDVLQ